MQDTDSKIYSKTVTGWKALALMLAIPAALIGVGYFIGLKAAAQSQQIETVAH